MIGESYNSKSSGQNSYPIQDIYANLVNVPSDQMGVSFGQAGSFGQRGLPLYTESKMSGGFLVTPEMWKSSFGQDQDQEQYLLDHMEQPLTNEKFELKFDELKLEDQPNQQYQRAQKSKSMMEMDSRRPRKKIDYKYEFGLDSGHQISQVFKPELANQLGENAELFNINQAKSIYINKISQLVDKPSPNLSASISPRSTKSQQKYQRKVSVKAERETDYYSSQEQNDVSKLSSDPLQQKLAKNRESARNSRKRKKIYVELLETKVNELTVEVERLKELCKNQNNIANKQGQENQQLRDFFHQEQELYDKLENVINDGRLPEQQQSELNLILDALRFRTGSNTNERIIAGKHNIDDMVKISLPVQTRYLMRCSDTNKDLFSPINECFDWSSEHYNRVKLSQTQSQQLLKFKSKVLQCKEVIDKTIESIQNHLSKINQEASKLDNIMDQVRNTMTPRQYATILMAINQNGFRADLSAQMIFNNLQSSTMSMDDDQPFQFAIDEEPPQVEVTRKKTKRNE